MGDLGVWCSSGFQRFRGVIWVLRILVVWGDERLKMYIN